MSKNRFCCLSFLLFFSILVPYSLVAEDLVGLKNLSWEEQKNATRIILETNAPLIYSVTANEASSQIEVELTNLDLRNLPQELFINTSQVVSMQTYPQTEGRKSRIIVTMTSFLQHQVSASGNTLYIDVEGMPPGDGLLAPVTGTLSATPPQVDASPAAEPAPEIVANTTEPAVEASQQAETTENETPTPSSDVESATMIRDVKIALDSDTADVVIVGNGSFDYDVFELTNPQRIVVDLKSVAIAPEVKAVQGSGSDMFSKVRLAQYQVSPKIARAVIDLNRKIPYSVVPEGAQLRIHLGESGDVSEAPSEAPAPAMAESEPAPAPVVPETADPAPAADPVLLADAAPAQEQKAPEMTNEQFFAIKPDTSLFTQGSGSPGTTPEMPPGTIVTATGQKAFQERTLSTEQKQYTGEPFSFDFKDIDIKDLFRFIADISGLNVILDPSIKGSVTLKLTEVPWDQALDLITKNQGLGYTIEGNVIRIAPLNKIVAEERARVAAEKEQMLSAPLVTKIKPLSYSKAKDVDKVIKKLLTPKGTTITDDRTNTIIITDITSNIDQVLGLVDTLDSRTSQVIIEARVVETRKNYSQAFGIQWGFRGIVDPAYGNNTTLQFPNNLLIDASPLQSTRGGIANNPLDGYAINLPTNAAPNTAIGISAGNVLNTFRLDLALMALENTGNGRVISSPKVTTQNNNKAEILQGFQIPVQTIANNTIAVTYVKAALRMEVTPQITADGTVILDVQVENNRPDFANATFAGTPLLTERAETTVLVEDGGTTVIGGIFQATDNYGSARTPVLHRIPLLGWLFRNQNIERSNSELLIFITPRIVR